MYLNDKEFYTQIKNILYIGFIKYDTDGLTGLSLPVYNIKELIINTKAGIYDIAEARLVKEGLVNMFNKYITMTEHRFPITGNAEANATF